MLIITEAVNQYYRMDPDYRSYRLSASCQDYNDDVAGCLAKKEKRLEVQLESTMFDGSDSLSKPRFLPAFQMACNASGAYKGAEMLLLHFSMKKPGGATDIEHICLSS